MKKIALIGLILSFLASNAFAVDVTFTFDSEQADRLIDIIDNKYPISETCDEEGENCTPDQTYVEKFKQVTIQKWLSDEKSVLRRTYVNQFSFAVEDLAS